jgi:hypothetical protein
MDCRRIATGGHKKRRRHSGHLLSANAADVVKPRGCSLRAAPNFLALGLAGAKSP